MSGLTGGDRGRIADPLILNTHVAANFAGQFGGQSASRGQFCGDFQQAFLDLVQRFRQC